VQAADMLVQLTHHFKEAKILCVCDSWFGNNEEKPKFLAVSGANLRIC